MLFLLGTSVSVFAQEAELMDLEKAVLTGLERNFGLKIAANNVAIAERNVQIGVGSFFMPRFDANVVRSFSKEDVEQTFATDPNNPREILDAKSNNQAFSVVGIYGFRPETIFTVKRLGKLAEISDLQAKVLVENTVAAVSVAYFRLVLELQRYNVLKTTLDLSQARLEIAKARYDLGGAGKSDYLTAQVDYNADLSRLISQDLVIKNAKINVNELLALAPETDFVVKDSIVVEGKLSLEDLVENAYMNNKAFLLAQRQENAAFLAMKESQALRLPFLNLNGSFVDNTFKSDAGFLIQNQRQGFNYGATIGVNLFTGLTINRRIQNAKVDRANAEYVLQDIEIQMTADIQRAYNNYTTNLQLLDIEYANYKVAINNVDIALDRFRLGLSDYLQFRDAQINLLTAENRLITALFSIREMEIELMRLSGRIFFQDGSQQFKLTLE